MAKLPLQSSIVQFLKNSFKSEASKRQLESEFKIKPVLSRKFRNQLRKLVANKILLKKKSGNYSVFTAKKQVRGKLTRDNIRASGWERAIGRVELKKGRNLLFKIMNPGFKPLLIPLDKNYKEVAAGDLISVTIQAGGVKPMPLKNLFKNKDAVLRAHFIAMLQKAIPFSEISRAFFKEHDVPGPLPKSAEKEASSFSAPQAGNYSDRVDYSQESVIAIDPFGARDHDDALSLKKRPGGGWILAVHIADVSEYVKPGGMLHREALKRSFTRYLPWTSVPMLPKVLANDLCSLKEGQLRLAFTCNMEIGAHGSIEKYEFFESLVRVSRFYTYEEALKEKNTGNPELLQLASLAGQLLNKRKREGLLNFDLPESNIALDNDGTPVSITRKERVISYSWIEECMLAANKCCAQFLKKNHLPGLHRTHEPPESEDIRQFFRAYREAGAKISGNQLIESVKKSRKNKQEVLRNLYIDALNKTSDQVHRKILKSLKKAEYSKSASGHFALGFDDYAHFTSPIRRFPDLWNHRLMKMSLKTEKIPVILQEEVKSIAESTSEVELEVMKLERKAVRSAVCWILSDYTGAVFKGSVYDLDSVGISILLDYNFIYGDVWVPLSKLKDDFYIFDERTMSLRGKRTHRKIQLKDSLTLKLIQTDPVLARTNLEILHG